jgi:hypothetical protein
LQSAIERLHQSHTEAPKEGFLPHFIPFIWIQFFKRRLRFVHKNLVADTNTAASVEDGEQLFPEIYVCQAEECRFRN